MPTEKQPLDAGFHRAAGAAAGRIATSKAQRAKLAATAERRPIGWRSGRQRGRAGHRRVVHGRAGAARSVLPSVLQRGRAGDAARPAADVLRGQQRRQRRAARIWCGCWRAAAIAGALSSSARAAARWRRRPRFAFCCASCAATLGSEAKPDRRARRAGDRDERASCSSWPRRSDAARRFRCPTASAGGFRCCRRSGLLPAALLGLDIEKLLAGAAAMNEHFRTAPPGENVVLQLRRRVPSDGRARGCDVRVLATWGKRLEAFGLWYDQLLAESLGKQERGALPLTVVNTRDLHSRGQQHQEGKRDKLITNLIVERPQRRAGGDRPQRAGSGRAQRAGRQDAARHSWRRRSRARTRPIATTTGRRPTCACRGSTSTRSGQLFQMMMLATVVEGPADRDQSVRPAGRGGVQERI